MASQTENITVLSQNLPRPEPVTGDQAQETDLSTQMAYIGAGTIISVGIVFFWMIISAYLLRKKSIMADQGITIFGKLPTMLPCFLRKKQKRKGPKGSHRHRTQPKLSEVTVSGKLSDPTIDTPLEDVSQGELGHGSPDAVISNNDLYHVTADLTKPTEAPLMPACTPAPQTNMSGLTQLPDEILHVQGDVQLTITSEVMEATTRDCRSCITESSSPSDLRA